MMNTRYLVTAVCWCIVSVMLGQTYTGKVVDENQVGISYANVILRQKTDSVFIAGCVTDIDGCFNLKTDLNASARELKISFIGYTTQIIDVNNGFNGEIQLKSESRNLQEVVVKGHKPVYEMKNGALSTQITGTVLSQLGTASDVLKQLPFVTGRENEISIFGRGTPVIYLNNRLVRSSNELEQVKSDHIKNVEIIMNPGSRYSSEVNAVIKITTLRPVGDGIGGSLSLRGRQKREFVYDGQFDLTYRKGGLDLFAMTDYAVNKSKQEQGSCSSFLHNSLPYKLKSMGNLNLHSKPLGITGGLNYSFAHQQFAGIRYTYNKTFNSPAFFSFLNEVQEGTVHSSYHSENTRYQGSESHYVNAYYQKSFNKGSFNIDGTFMNKSSSSSATDRSYKDDMEKIVPSESDSKSNLYALEIWGAFPLGNGTLNLGTEGTRTINEQNFLMKNEDYIEDFPSNLSKSNQTGIAAYAAYYRNWKHLSLSAGLRYEYVDFDYSVNGVKQDEESKRYGNLFPFLSFSYRKDRLSMSLTYRTLVVRPGYGQLRSSISYNNDFSYEGGNPALQQSINHNLGFLLSYHDFFLDCTYSYKKDDIMFYRQHFENKPVILSTFMNHDRQTFSANLSYAPTFSIWRPSFTAGLFMQKISYAGLSYNKPMFQYAWKNLLTLPNAWMINLNLNGSSYGSVQVSANRSSLNSDISIRKSFKKTLDVYLGASDLFNTYRERWLMNMDDIYFDKWNNPDYRCVYVKVVLKFNKASNKYKGGYSGQSERGRL